MTTKRTDLWPLQRVFQQHDDGCGTACLAMLAGISYPEACLAIFDDYQGDATSLDDLRWALMAYGFRVPQRMTPFWEGWYTELRQHALLAINPATDGMWHWVVWDGRNRRILDPVRWPSRKPVVVGSLVVRPGRATQLETRRHRRGHEWVTDDQPACGGSGRGQGSSASIARASPRAERLGPLSLQGLRQEGRDVDGKRHRKPVQQIDGRVEGFALDAADIAAVDVGIDGQALLREPTLDPQPSQVPSDTRPSVHRRDATSLRA